MATRACRSLALLLALSFVGCSEEPPDPPPAADPEWQIVFRDLPAGLLRAWGTSSTDVYVVGSAVGEGEMACTAPEEPYLLRFDGTKWRRLKPGKVGSVWWVFAVAPDDIRMVGACGLVLYYKPSTDTFTRKKAPTNSTLFGVWGASSNDVWYSGNNEANTGAVFRDNGSEISVVPVPATVTASTVIFKPHGVSANEIWFSGGAGVTLYWNGTELQHRQTPVPFGLNATHGLRKDRMYAVGGGAQGVLLGWNGMEWIEESEADKKMIGLWVVSDDEVYAVGENGAIYHRKDGTWAKEDRVGTGSKATKSGDSTVFDDYHSIWVDEKGGIWLAGGALSVMPPVKGVLAYYGPPISKDIEE